MRQRWGIDELIESWSLDQADWELVGNKTGATRLGFAVLLKFFELEARFPRSIDEVPIEAVDFMGRQVDVRFESLDGYDWSGSSWKRHRRQIRARFGFRAWSLDDVEPAIGAVVGECLSGGGSRRHAAEALIGWCRRSCVEPPFAAAADRIIGTAIRRWEDQIRDDVSTRLSDGACRSLDRLVSDAGREDLTWLRADPGPVGVDSVVDELAKLDRLRSVDVPGSVADGIARRVVDQWYDRFQALPPSALVAMTGPSSSCADSVVAAS